MVNQVGYSFFVKCLGSLHFFSSFIAAIYIAGNSVGTCLIFPLGGFLAASDWGWRSIFYVTGGCGVAWSVLWLFFAFDTPAKHPRYS